MVFKKAVLSIYITTWLVVFVAGKQCVSQDGCSCNFDDGSGTIDLSSLTNSDGTPRFKDVPYATGGNGRISYNPCQGFSEDDCTDAAVCMVQSDRSQNIGDADSAQLLYDDNSGHLYAGYTSRDLSETRSTQVKLICDETACDATFTPTEGGPSEVIVQYFAILKTICACPNMCTASGPKSCGAKTSGISAGSIILIGVVSLFMMYVVVGAVYMKFVKKAAGSDILPNKDVWTGGFSLIGAGFKFILSKCFPNKFSVHTDVK